MSRVWHGHRVAGRVPERVHGHLAAPPGCVPAGPACCPQIGGLRWLLERSVAGRRVEEGGSQDGPGVEGVAQS
eukprot:287686-Chlamydomonas_euryale.AAC.1